MNALPVPIAREFERLKIRHDKYAYRRYAELFGEKPKFNALPIVRDLVTYKLQCDYYGGLGAWQEEVLMNLLDKVDKDDLKNILPGTRLTRHWNGKTYEVIARPDQKYEYEGTIYNSLSAIAEQITGSHRSGKAFFGVA